MELSEEYAARVVNSVKTGAKCTISGNVPNDGLIDNLGQDATVEVPVRVDGEGFHPETMGNLPSQCAMLCRRSIETQRFLVKGLSERKTKPLFYAMLADSLTIACLDPGAIRRLFNDLITTEKEKICCQSGFSQFEKQHRLANEFTK
ncbi:MAG: hypothetical protein ACLFWL_02010 [Candidatus Brocadiia bacterium]